MLKDYDVIAKKEKDKGVVIELTLPEVTHENNKGQKTHSYTRVIQSLKKKTLSPPKLIYITPVYSPKDVAKNKTQIVSNGNGKDM